MIQILYPSDDFNLKEIDEHYQNEAALAKSLGYHIGIIDLNNFKDSGKGLMLTDKELPTIYRGWMLNESHYKNLANKINLLISPENYLYSHHIINWYEQLKNYTIPTIFVENKDSIPTFEQSFFIKDYVKSNTGKLGSIANTKMQALSIIAELEMYRGEIEGGICLRETISIDKNSEKRYFIFNNKVFSNDMTYPKILDHIAAKLPSSIFCSADIALSDGKEILIEIGDGQVSDIKEWKLINFSHVLEELKSLDIRFKIKP